MNPNLAYWLLPVALASCTSGIGEHLNAPLPSGAERLASERPRLAASTAAPADVDAQVLGNTNFALDLYRYLAAEEENVFFSPHSVSTAFAMAFSGASGQTADEIAEVFHFDLEEPGLHHAFNAIDQELAERRNEGVELELVNQSWGQSGYRFETDFLDVLAESYGAGMVVSDIAADPDLVRLEINDWVMDRTRDRVEDLIPEGAMTTYTRLVLVNAVYFNGAWKVAFDADLSADAPFMLRDGTSMDVPFMNQTEALGYGEGEGWRAVELPYAGDELAMLVVLPDDLARFEASLDAERLGAIVESIDVGPTKVALPRFSFGSHTSLKNSLSDLGMPTPFTDGAADFSRIDGSRRLYIQDAFHGAFIDVAEAGTEAAGATAVIFGNRAAEEIPEVAFNRPFLFLIRDRVTGSVLFVGRVVDPMS